MRVCPSFSQWTERGRTDIRRRQMTKGDSYYLLLSVGPQTHSGHTPTEGPTILEWGLNKREKSLSLPMKDLRKPKCTTFCRSSYLDQNRPIDREEFECRSMNHRGIRGKSRNEVTKYHDSFQVRSGEVRKPLRRPSALNSALIFLSILKQDLICRSSHTRQPRKRVRLTNI